jgi:hypothetical protein
MRRPNTIRSRPARDICPTRRRGLGAISRTVEVGLTADTIEQIANRVAHLLRAEPPPGQKPLTAGQLAHHLGVERTWVYRHRHLLGGERLGDGPKAPWRFDLETAKRGLAGHWAVQDARNGGL